MSSTSLKNTPGAGVSQNGVLPEANAVMIRNGRSTTGRLGSKPGFDSRSLSKSSKGALSIIPEPVRLVEGTGHFLINPETIIAADVDARPEAEFLAERLSTSMGCRFSVGDLGSDSRGRPRVASDCP